MENEKKDFTAREEGIDFEEIKEAAIKGSVQKKEGIKQITHVLEYISSVLGCEFPKNFAEHLYTQYSTKESFTLNTNHARGIIDDWRLWEPYVAPEDMCKYICHKLEVFCKIHCGVTYGSNHGELTAKSYIGTYARVVNPIPENTYCIIHSTGLVAINGKNCEVDENDPRAKHTSLRKKKSAYPGSVTHFY